MIRYVPVGKAIYPDSEEYKDSFTFFSTTSGRFLNINRKQHWPSWEDFVVDYKCNYGEEDEDYFILLERFKSLMPK